MFTTLRRLNAQIWRLSSTALHAKPSPGYQRLRAGNIMLLKSYSSKISKEMHDREWDDPETRKIVDYIENKFLSQSRSLDWKKISSHMGLPDRECRTMYHRARRIVSRDRNKNIKPRQQLLEISSGDRRLLDYVQNEFISQNRRLDWEAISQYMGLPIKQCQRKYYIARHRADSEERLKEANSECLAIGTVDRELMDYIQDRFLSKCCSPDWEMVSNHVGVPISECKAIFYRLCGAGAK